MSTMFIASLLIALLAVVYWRAVMMIAIVVLLALLLTGLGSIASVLHGAYGEPSDAVVPGTSGAPSAGAKTGSAGGSPFYPGPPAGAEQPPG